MAKLEPRDECHGHNQIQMVPCLLTGGSPTVAPQFSDHNFPTGRNFENLRETLLLQLGFIQFGHHGQAPKVLLETRGTVCQHFGYLQSFWGSQTTTTSWFLTRSFAGPPNFFPVLPQKQPNLRQKAGRDPLQKRILPEQTCQTGILSNHVQSTTRHCPFSTVDQVIETYLILRTPQFDFGLTLAPERQS